MGKHRDFDREAVVYVWRYKGPNHPGHASVKLSGLPEVDGYRKSYISWWPARGVDGKGDFFTSQKSGRNWNYHRDMYNEMKPGTRRNLDKGTFQPRHGQRMVLQYETGSEEWGQEADEKIRIPGMGAAGVLFGLDLARIHRWWEIFRSCPHPEYKYSSRNSNCAGVAILALRAGGADRWAPAPKVAIYVDPNQVARWAHQIRETLDRHNEAAWEVNQALINDGRQIDESVREVMSYEEWLTKSSRDETRQRFRSERLRLIDQLLLEYHTESWSTTPDVKLLLLGQIMDAINRFLRHKPTSKRGDAVLNLGEQVLSVARKQEKFYRTRLQTEKDTNTKYDDTMWIRKDIML